MLATLYPSESRPVWVTRENEPRVVVGWRGSEGYRVANMHRMPYQGQGKASYAWGFSAIENEQDVSGLSLQDIFCPKTS